MTRSRIVMVAFLAAALALAAGGAWSASASTHGTAGAMVGVRSASTNQRAARTDATALLSRLRLPAGAIEMASAPPGAGPVLAHPFSAPATPNLVDEHAWWVVPTTPAGLLSFIEHNHPAGSKLIQSGSGSMGLAMLGYGWPARLSVLSTRWLVIEVAALANGSTAVRADSQVVWITPRAESEWIPAAVARLTVTVLDGKRAVQGPFAFSARAKVDEVRSLVNGLPRFSPGAFACPADFGVIVRLTFYSRAGRAPLAVARVDPGGCESVALTIRGRRESPLTSMAFPGSGRSQRVSLVDQLDRALGVKLKTVPAA